MIRTIKSANHLSTSIHEPISFNPHTIRQTRFPPSRQMSLPVYIPNRLKIHELSRTVKSIRRQSDFRITKHRGKPSRIRS